VNRETTELLEAVEDLGAVHASYCPLRKSAGGTCKCGLSRLRDAAAKTRKPTELLEEMEDVGRDVDGFTGFRAGDHWPRLRVVVIIQ